MPVWREIRSDVRGIARQLGLQVAATRRSGAAAQRRSGAAASVTTTHATPTAAPTARPAGRRTAASATSSPRAQVAPMVQRSPGGRFLPRAGAAVAEGVTRDQRGRFVAGGKGGGDVGHQRGRDRPD
ncbi:hypothetical protein J2X16_000777 [Pelomonas aquatica]|uniref:Uncharacterized protein n=1 Tax=Pelomonas aquatica TaxID=431058 RepID=A0ABU1Z605_9BURK|nr:hypothetical protein [Pelomonas aquatica]MDR7295456.1 hypothetical protein [Pelomonas aquatica]